jgi:putative transposase
MPNHYHFLLQQNGDSSISKFIGIVFNQYVQYTNHLNSKRGPLFEGRFKHIMVDKDEYLQILCRYIHLNPVSAGLVVNAADWKYSDYIEWASGKCPYVNDYFLSVGDYVNFVQENQHVLPLRYKID